MNKKLLIGSITAALVLGGTFAVGASELPIFDLKTNKLLNMRKSSFLQNKQRQSH